MVWITNKPSLAVQSTIEKYPNNKVLLQKPPMINPEEIKLTRKERAGLARLRSGYCCNLNSYMKIDKTNQVQDVCPLCNDSAHDASHLFSCISNPINLNVMDLWTKPSEAAIFLKLNDDEACKPKDVRWGANQSIKLANFLAAATPDFFSKPLRLQGVKNSRLRHRLTSPDLMVLDYT